MGVLNLIGWKCLLNVETKLPRDGSSKSMGIIRLTP